MRADTAELDVATINCPRCPARGTPETIEAHLVEQHLVSPSDAQKLVRERAALHIVPKETPMADLSTPIKCKACTKPFVRKQGRETYCPECAKTPKCGGCKWRGGMHSPRCPRSKGGKPKKATGGGRRAKPKPTPPRREAAPVTLTETGTRKKAEDLLADLRRLRAKLDEKIGHVAELVDVL